MTSLERLFAGTLAAVVMALPAYAQTQNQPQATQPIITQPIITQPQAMQHNSTRPESTRPESSLAKDAPTNAELALDAVSEPETDDDDVTIEDSAILPSAGDQKASRAPSMDLDCTENPKNCLNPLTSNSSGPTLSIPPAK